MFVDIGVFWLVISTFLIIGTFTLVCAPSILQWLMHPRRKFYRLYSKYPLKEDKDYFYDENKGAFYVQPRVYSFIWQIWSKLGFLVDRNKGRVYLVPAWSQVVLLRLAGLGLVAGSLYVIALVYIFR